MERENFGKISKQTMEGLKITAFSMIECTRFLLRSGMPYVLTEKFTQDNLELYFGLQRTCGYRSDNPTLYQFGYNDNGIRMKGSLSKTRVEGNTKGGQKKENILGARLMMKNFQNVRKKSKIVKFLMVYLYKRKVKLLNFLWYIYIKEK